MDWSDRLGQLLVTRVRDRALQDMIKMTDGSAKAPELVAKLAHLKARHGEDGVAGARFVLEEAVDHVLHHMLVLFEDEQDALELVHRRRDRINFHVAPSKAPWVPPWRSQSPPSNDVSWRRSLLA